MMNATLSLKHVIGHRGASAYAPENTMASFRQAHELGIQWVEFDVKLTRDNQLIIFHDSTLERTTNGAGEVAQYTFAELSKLDCGSWYSLAFLGERIPKLSTIVTQLAAWGMCANLEIKACRGREKETAMAVMDFVCKEWPSNMPLPLISSFSLESLQVVRDRSEHQPIGLLANRCPNDWQALWDRLQFCSIHLYHRSFEPTILQTFKAHGLKTIAYTVNQPKRATQLFRWGLDAVFSDRPDKIIYPDRI